MKKEKEQENKSKRARFNSSLSLSFRLVLVLVMFLMFSVVFVSAVPPLPTEIYGVARTYNQQIMPGTFVNVYDSENNFCGSFRARNTTWNASYFGVLTCRGEDDTYTGPTEGEILSFRIGSAAASPIAFVGFVGNGTTAKYANYSQTNITWESGSFKEVIIVAPPLVCGDTFCDLYENCNSCPRDCNVCPAGNGSTVTNNTGNVTPGGGSGGGGGGGGGGETNPGGGTTEPGTTIDVGSAQPGGASAANEAPSEDVFCEEFWDCGDWTECLPNNMQLRDCIDFNDCGTSKEMPKITQDCVYSGDEFPINGTERNDTGKVPPRRETPALISICKEKLPLFSIPSLLFIGLVFLVTLIAEIDYRRKLKRIDSDQSLDELKKLELRYFEHRKKIIFFVVILVLAIVVYFYHYFFYMCKDKYIMYLWLLAAGVLMAPVMVHLTIEFMGYSEEDKNRRVGVLNDIHYKHFELLLEIADKELIAAEQRITSKIYNLEKTQEFNKLLSRDKIVNKIYSDMTKLFNLYKTLKNPMFVERDLLENIRKLDEDEEFTNACKAYPELMEIKSNLSLLYSAYEYKQTIYDELAFIEKEYGVNDPIIR